MPDSSAGDIEFRDVSFSRPGRPEILHGVTLRAHPGDVLAVIGRNGVGKTTLLKLVNVLLLPSRTTWARRSAWGRAWACWTKAG